MVNLSLNWIYNKQILISHIELLLQEMTAKKQFLNEIDKEISDNIYKQVEFFKQKIITTPYAQTLEALKKEYLDIVNGRYTTSTLSFKLPSARELMVIGLVGIFYTIPILLQARLMFFWMPPLSALNILLISNLFLRFISAAITLIGGIYLTMKIFDTFSWSKFIGLLTIINGLFIAFNALVLKQGLSFSSMPVFSGQSFPFMVMSVITVQALFIFLTNWDYVTQNKSKTQSEVQRVMNSLLHDFNTPYAQYEQHLKMQSDLSVRQNGFISLYTTDSLNLHASFNIEHHKAIKQISFEYLDQQIGMLSNSVLKRKLLNLIEAYVNKEEPQFCRDGLSTILSALNAKTFCFFSSESSHDRQKLIELKYLFNDYIGLIDKEMAAHHETYAC